MIGEWFVSGDGRHIINQFDFEHDVKLVVDGDFEDEAARVAYANALCEKLNGGYRHPAKREAGRVGDMRPPERTHMRVGFDADGDVWIEVWEHREGEEFGRSSVIEFCTYTGGGRSPRTREALIALMVAMEEDNREEPARRWPPERQTK